MAKKFDSITQKGLKAHELAARHRGVLEARLEPGALDALARHLGLLGASVSQQLTARQSMKSATVSQAKALENAAAIVSAIRNAVKAHKADAATQKAFAVGVAMQAKVVKSVASAGGAILGAWARNPDRGRAHGVLEADIAALTAALTAAQAADREQDEKRRDAPLATKARNAASGAVEAATRKIAAAGILQFATQPEIRGEFEELLAGPARKRPKRATPTPPPIS